MKPELLTQIQNAEINVQPYAPKSRALPTEEETNQRRESLKKSGLINPIIITEDENHNPLIVDGYIRYQLICELKKEGNWSDSLPVLEISLDKAKVYRDIQTNHKNYTKFQLAIFGAYNYWDEVEKDSLLRRQQGKKVTDKKGKTSEIVGRMSGVNEKYAQYAHELLEIDAKFFYETFFIKRYSLKKDEIKELLAAKNDEKLIKEIIDEMKNIAEENTQTSHASIYGQAKSIVDSNHKPAYERLIRKQTASDTEAEEIKNALFAKASESDDAIFATNTKLVNPTCEETTEKNSVLNIVDENNCSVLKENYSTKSDNAKVFLLKRKYCVVVTSQPLPEDIQARIKEIVEDNIAYEVKVTYASVGEDF